MKPTKCGERDEKDVEGVDEELLACREGEIALRRSTRAVSAQAARNVARLKATLSSGAQRRAPKTPRQAGRRRGGLRAAGGIPRYRPPREIDSLRWRLLERLEMMEIQTVELLADLEEEDAEHEHRDEDIERNAELDDHRHAVGGAHGPEEQAILHRQETNHLRHRLAPRNHREEGEQHHGDGDADGVARGGAREREIGCARPKANTTISTPTSIVPEMLSSGSVSQ